MISDSDDWGYEFQSAPMAQYQYSYHAPGVAVDFPIAPWDAEDAVIVVEQAEDIMEKVNEWLVEWWAILEYGKLGGNDAVVHPQGS